MVKYYVKPTKAYRVPQIKTKGTSLVFDEAGPQEGDPVEIICSWCLQNLTPEQLRAICMGLSDTAQESGAPAGMDEDGPSGFSGSEYRRQGPQSGPGGAGPSRPVTSRKASSGPVGDSRLITRAERAEIIRNAVDETRERRGYAPERRGYAPVADVGFGAIFGREPTRHVDIVGGRRTLDRDEVFHPTSNGSFEQIFGGAK